MKKWLLLLPLPFLPGCGAVLLGFAVGSMIDMASFENRNNCQNEAIVKTMEHSTKSSTPLESSELRNFVDKAFKECMKGKFGEEIPDRVRSEEEICRSQGMMYNPNMPGEGKCFK